MFDELNEDLESLLEECEFRMGSTKQLKRIPESKKPTFKFDYLSLGKSDYCFNYEKIALNDFVKLFERFQVISNLTYGEILENPREYRFHTVDKLKPKLEKYLLDISSFSSLNDNQIPIIYQLSIYTSEERSPRLMGFLYGPAAYFYLVWLDYDHVTFKRKESN